MWMAKIENEKYLCEDVPDVVNRWIDTPPYDSLQDVLIQNANGKVTLGWVASRVESDGNGQYRIGGIYGGNGAQTLKYYMIVPFPFDDPTGWTFSWDEERTPRKGQQYLVTVETEDVQHKKHYRLAIGWCKPGKYSDWDGFDYKGCKDCVIAWRVFPPARQ